MFLSGRTLWRAVLGACVWMLVGCGGAREVRPPRLARSVVLGQRAGQFAAGARGWVYYTVMSYGGPAAANELHTVEANGSPGAKVRLEPGAEVKAVAADGLGTLYLGVRKDGTTQVWVVAEHAGGETVEPKAKLTPELPGELNGLFLGREPGTLYALCGDNWVVKLRTDGSVVQRVELPGDSRPEDGGVDAAGNLCIRRSGGPVVKVGADGTVDAAWAKSAAATHTSVRSVAVDSRGLVYVSASERDIHLRAYDANGELAFNVTAEPLASAPDRLVVTAADWLYAQVGQQVFVFRP